jgi:hypothetical protein
MCMMISLGMRVTVIVDGVFIMGVFMCRSIFLLACSFKTSCCIASKCSSFIMERVDRSTMLGIADTSVDVGVSFDV